MVHPEFTQRYGPVALVLGASEGIGESFARSLAIRGLDLVLVARREAPLRALADRLTAEHKVRAVVVPLDLADDALPAPLEALAADHDIGLVVYNAAFSGVGAFLERSLEDRLREVAVNVRGPAITAHLFGRRLAARGRGGIVLMSSVSGIVGTASVANYAATKAYNEILAEGLWYELKSRGVDIVASLAGATKTPGYLASSKREPANRLARPMDPGPVAEQALRDLGKRPVSVPGLGNRFAATLLRRLMPRRAAIQLISEATTAQFAPGPDKP